MDVKNWKERELRGSTVEETIWHKIDYLQECRENTWGDKYDQLINSIEKLFRAFPKVREEIGLIKDELDVVFYDEKIKIGEEADRAGDIINREKYIKEEIEELMWEYRNLYEDAIIDTMQKYKLIPMSKPHYTEMKSIIPDETIIESQPQEFQQPTQQPLQFQQPTQDQQQPQFVDNKLMFPNQQPQQQNMQFPQQDKPKKKAKLSIRRK